MIEPTKEQIRALWNAAVSYLEHETMEEWAARLLRAALNVTPAESLIVDGSGWAEVLFDGCVEVRTAGGFGLADLKNYPL